MKSYTDIEQSKKLAEILPLETADMKYKEYTSELDYSSKHCSVPAVGHPFKRDIPCWSLAVLLNLLPSEFTEKGKYSETTYKIDIRKHALTEDVDVYQIAYGNYKIYEDGNSLWKDMINTGEKENLIDVAFDMICWLKENKKL